MTIYLLVRVYFAFIAAYTAWLKHKVKAGKQEWMPRNGFNTMLHFNPFRLSLYVLACFTTTWAICCYRLNLMLNELVCSTQSFPWPLARPLAGWGEYQSWRWMWWHVIRGWPYNQLQGWQIRNCTSHATLENSTPQWRKVSLKKKKKEKQDLSCWSGFACGDF